MTPRYPLPHVLAARTTHHQGNMNTTNLVITKQDVGQVPASLITQPGTHVPSSTPVFNPNLTLQRLDRVRLSNGNFLIVTGYHPERPANIYSGVKENGHGKEYIFGNKHRPVKFGTVTENHPALRANRTRIEQRFGVQAPPQTDSKDRVLILRLLDSVEQGNLEQARFIAACLRDTGFKN